MAESVGSVEAALAHAGRLLNAQPALAVEQVGEILRAVPGHPQARLLLAMARRRCGDADAALAMLHELVREQPRFHAAQLELAHLLAGRGLKLEAIDLLRRCVAQKPDFPDAWRALADVFDAVDDPAAAEAAREAFLQCANRDPRLMAAGAALVENRIPEAEALLRAHLLQHDTDIAALRMLAEVAARIRRYPDAEALLERCLSLAPGFDAARHQYGVVLLREMKLDEALAQADRLLAKHPRNPAFRNLRAAVFAHRGDYTDSIEGFETLLAEFPDLSHVWVSYGHSLKTAGRTGDSIEAYRRAIALTPTLGEAYWSLANLKTFRFGPAEVEAMRAALSGPSLRDDDRLHFEFALGKALEDAGEYAESFVHYDAGSAIRRTISPYSADLTTRFMRRSKGVYTPALFSARAGTGCPAADPIFIVGMPRAGSTLLEQIISSHPLVEGTMELPDIGRAARELAFEGDQESDTRYPQVVATLAPDRLRELGEHYLRETRVQRKTDAPFFIDKMPNNFLQTGLIQLMLPNAKIIDARRHPLGCCFSNFKQHFARGQNFSYSLDDVGRYYRDYVEMMAHFDAVLPGRVHRVIYERLIEDTEGEVRRLLDYLGLPFDEACLRFYENTRAVRTASSEQVRQPIYRDGVDHWRHYEPWLGPLKAALGPVLDLYPEVPEFN